MKILKKIALSVVVIIGLASCKNDYECVCLWGNDTKLTEVTHAVGKMKVGDAQYYCDQAQFESLKAMSLGIATDTFIKCDLKKLN